MKKQYGLGQADGTSSLFDILAEISCMESEIGIGILPLIGCGFTVFTIQPLEKNQYKISSKKYCDRFEIKKLTQYLKDAGFSHFEEK